MYLILIPVSAEIFGGCIEKNEDKTGLKEVLQSFAKEIANHRVRGSDDDAEVVRKRKAVAAQVMGMQRLHLSAGLARAREMWWEDCLRKVIGNRLARFDEMFSEVLVAQAGKLSARSSLKPVPRMGGGAVRGGGLGLGGR